MPRKKTTVPEPEIVRLTNALPAEGPLFTITNITEGDLRRLRDGTVPDWIVETAEFWLRDNPKPSDVPARREP